MEMQVTALIFRNNIHTTPPLNNTRNGKEIVVGYTQEDELSMQYPYGVHGPSK